jgi:hypothetical protein
MTTIPRNHPNVIAALKTQYPYAVARHKDDAYTGHPTDAQRAWDTLTENRRATLTRGSERLTIRHPLGWFDLFPDEAAYIATLPAAPSRRAVVFPVLKHRATLGELRRAVPGEVLKALLRNADEALATAGGEQAHTALLAAMAELEQAGHPREAAIVEAIVDELAAAITASGDPR